MGSDRIGNTEEMVLLLWVSAPEAIFERHDDLFDTSKADALDDILLTGGERWIKRDRSSLQYTQRHGNDDMGAFYIYIYVYLYVYIYCICICIGIYVYIYIYIHIHTRTQ